MIIELAMVGMLSCSLRDQEIVHEDRKCYYVCQDGTKDFASTLKQYQCPYRLYVDREPVPFQQRLKNPK